MNTIPSVQKNSRTLILVCQLAINTSETIKKEEN